MKFKTWLYRYSVVEHNHMEYYVVRKCWLWGVTDKYLNRFGELESKFVDECYFSSETMANKHLVKYLKHLSLF